MRFPSAKQFSTFSLTCALAMLVACANEPPVFKDRVVKVPVPVRAEIDPRLTEDCEPAADVPLTGVVTVLDALNRLAAVEIALAKCRHQLAQIREIK